MAEPGEPGEPVIGDNGALPLPMSGSLPPDLQGTLLRVGPAWPWGAAPAAGAGGAAGEGEGTRVGRR